MRSEDLVLVDQAARQLNGQGVVALGVLRDHPELPATDPAGGVDLFHRDFGSGPALDAVAGPLLGQRHHESHDDLIAEGMGEGRQRQHRDKYTTEEDERSLHRISSLLEKPLGNRAPSGQVPGPDHHPLPDAAPPPWLTLW
jgi:hypothetical protein